MITRDVRHRAGSRRHLRTLLRHIEAGTRAIRILRSQLRAERLAESRRRDDVAQLLELIDERGMTARTVTGMIR